MLSRYHALRRLLHFRGFGYLLRLLTDHFLPRLVRGLLFRVGPRRLRWLAVAAGMGFAAVAGLAAIAALGMAAGAGLVALVVFGFLAGVALRHWWRRGRRLSEARHGASRPQGFFLLWSEWPVAENVRRAIDTASPSRPAAARGEIVLGHIDGDGRLESSWGVFPDFEPVSAEDFVPRTRFTLDLVLLEGRVLIRKDYRGRRSEFLDEWYVLGRLRGRANVPAVYAVCEERCLLYRSFIPGETINDRLVQSGARIRLVQTRADAALSELNGTARLEAVLERGTRRLSSAVPLGTLDEIERQLDLIHRVAVAGLSLTFGNVVLDHRGAPWLIDFDGAEAFRSTRSAVFAYRRDQDRVKYNRFYGRNLLTETEASSVLQNHFRDAYAPIDLGQGLATRGFWSVDSGTGRWEFFLGKALSGLVEGRRILDLGSHHGLMPLLMLAAGARQVVAVEKSSESVARGHHLRRLFEWRHMRSFDLDLRFADMRTILDGEWGEFDLVTAFCSLYYLPADDMRRVVRRAAQLAPVLVVQAKTDTRAEAADNKAEKSSVAFLRSVLEEHGFPRVEVFAPAGYSRPLLIGHRKGSKHDPALRHHGSAE